MLSVAIVGCEQIHAQDYLDTSLADPRVRVVAVASERDPARARRLAAPHDLPVVDDFTRLPEVDLAFVTTAIEDHEAAVSALLPRARHLFVEKPLAVSAARATALAEQLTGRSCFSGFYLRTDPALQLLRQQARDGAIGNLSHLSLTAGHPGLLEGWLSDWPAHLDERRMGYGAFGDLAVHLLDFSAWLCGEALTVTHSRLDRDPRWPLDHDGEALLQAGALPIHLRASATLRGPRLAIRLDGSEGTLELSAGRLVLHDAKGHRQVLVEGVDPGVPQGAQAVFDQLLGQPRPELASLAEALAANRLLDELYGRVEGGFERSGAT
ncbi:Gfo/Idh/MocA family oxidoreductase [Pseudomonas oryzihabitans]|uniref:Gfo/Idh/MocA family protein n=1 Tax=Pseudomonas oryzihabitans TaxID=47885 RepID=UPI0014749C8B|nr:Gfo/Idh/MocA family oxidoreductase [Pseudomonas oryzihabitans]NMZ66284.1 Gfo/Idh/MocA family oxidoreductase [Pseudomonas oryzihabitans]